MATLSAQSSTRTDENASARMQGKGDVQARRKTSRKAFGEITNNVPLKASVSGKTTQQTRPKKSLASSSRRKRTVDLDFDNLPEVESMIPYVENIQEPVPARYASLLDMSDDESSTFDRTSLREPPCKWEELPSMPNSRCSFVMPEIRTDTSRASDVEFSGPAPHEMVDFAAVKAPASSLCSKSTNDDLDRFFAEMGFV